MSPVLLTYAWVAYLENGLTLAAFLFVACIVLVLLCVILLKYASKNLERKPFKAVSVEAADCENTAFLLLYLLPLFTENIVTLNWQVWVPVTLIFAVVAATGYAYHFNPLLGLIGWHFYKVNTEYGVTYVLITKKHLKNANEAVAVVQLTEYIVMDLVEQA